MANESGEFYLKLKAVVESIDMSTLQKEAAKLNLKITPIVDTQASIKNLDVIKNRVSELRSTIDKGAKFTIQTDTKTNEVIGATIEYSNAVGEAVKETWKMVDATGEVTNEISKSVGMEKTLETTTNKVSDINNNILNTLVNNAKKVAEWAISTGLIYGSLKEIRDAMEYIVSLNKEMTNIRIVTGVSAEEAGAIAVQYNELARALGATTLEIAQGSVEWHRQGKTVEETSKLMEATMAMSKLGNMESAQATEYLTSTLNGFKMGAEDAMGVVDNLIMLDNEYATSVAEIASALQRSSNSAQQAGVSFEELASYITVVSSVTRKSAESIGESFKTMFARMQTIKMGQMWEDDTTKISDVENALSLAKISIFDANKEFRDMSDVLDELAPKWDTLGSKEQSAIAQAVAGKYYARTYGDIWEIA